MTGAGELRSAFASTTGGVMTVEAGAITGDLELLTRPSPAGDAVEAYVRYAGAGDLYAVAGSPVRAVSAVADAGEHRAAHERILERLSPGPREHEGGNEAARDLLTDG